MNIYIHSYDNPYNLNNYDDPDHINREEELAQRAEDLKREQQALQAREATDQEKE